MADNFDLSVTAESKLLALEYMKQKNLADDNGEFIAREYRRIQQEIEQTLKSL